MHVGPEWAPAEAGTLNLSCSQPVANYMRAFGYSPTTCPGISLTFYFIRKHLRKLNSRKRMLL